VGHVRTVLAMPQGDIDLNIPLKLAKECKKRPFHAVKRVSLL
jgi:hypothetical protein